MKQFILHLLCRLVLWLLPPDAEPEPDTLKDAARPLMDAQDAIAGRSGEAKRHQVLAALLKQFPAHRERDIAFAIECVMQERG